MTLSDAAVENFDLASQTPFSVAVEVVEVDDVKGTCIYEQTLLVTEKHVRIDRGCKHVLFTRELAVESLFFGFLEAQAALLA